MPRDGLIIYHPCYPHLFSVSTKLGYKFLSFLNLHNIFSEPLDGSKPKSVALFARSVNSNDIKATKCDNRENFRSGACSNGERVTFGENVSPDARGKYFLRY